MGMVVIGGGGCLQTTAFPAEGVPLLSNASRAVLAHLRLPTEELISEHVIKADLTWDEGEFTTLGIVPP